MEVRAKARFVRIAPRKVRRVLDLIRGKETGEALSILKLTPGAVAPIIEKLLKSALANAKVRESLYVAQVTCDPGPTLPRWMPRAFGKATKIKKRTSHITIILKEKQGEPEVKSKKLKVKSKTG